MSRFSVSTETIRILNEEGEKLVYMKIIKQSPLKSYYKLLRTQWSGKHMLYGHK